MTNEDNKQDWQRFLSLLHQAFDEKVGEELLQLILTIDEKEVLGTRLRIIEELLAQEMTQREIKDELGVGIATITRGSNCLKLAKPEMKKWLEDKLL